MKFNRIYSVNEQENTVTLNKDFFEALFVNQSLRSGRTLSSVSLRLAAILLEKLDEFEAKELPPRTYLAERLNTSRTSVINSLVQLEENQFLIRQVSIIQAIVGPSEEEKKKYYKISQEHLKGRNFSDKFLINRCYNQEYKPINEKELIEVSNKAVEKYLSNDILINKLYELETRVKKLEQKFKE